MSSPENKQVVQRTSPHHWREGLVCDEYWPIGRYLVDSDDDEHDELVENEAGDPSGVPDEVLGPRCEWVPLDIFVERVAVNWKRTLLRPEADGERVLTFSRVLDYRIERHQRYAELQGRNESRLLMR